MKRREMIAISFPHPMVAYRPPGGRPNYAPLLSTSTGSFLCGFAGNDCYLLSMSCGGQSYLSAGGTGRRNLVIQVDGIIPAGFIGSPSAYAEVESHGEAVRHAVLSVTRCYRRNVETFRDGNLPRGAIVAFWRRSLPRSAACVLHRNAWHRGGQHIQQQSTQKTSHWQ